LSTGGNIRGERGRDYVLYFGRLAYEKGLDVLLRAVKMLPEIKFKIIGQGPLLPALSEMAKRHGLQMWNFCRTNTAMICGKRSPAPGS